MAVSDALRSAASRIMGVKPSVFFSSTNVLENELTELVNDVAQDIARSHDWRVLTKLAEMTGTGSDESFALPLDYSRMPIKASLSVGDGFANCYVPINDLDAWANRNSPVGYSAGGCWIMLGGQLHIVPIVSLGEKARFYYISNYIVKNANGETQRRFQKDDDTFLLDEDLLTLGLIWRYRHQKRLDYTDDQALFEKRFNEIAGKDKGSHILAIGRTTTSLDVSPAYPQVLG